MTELKTLKELVDTFANSVTEAGLAWATNDQESFKRAKTAMQKTFQVIRKKDKELNSLAELMETTGHDYVRAVTAQWVLKTHEERSLKVLDILAKDDNAVGRYASKVASEWRERRKILERRYKNYNLIFSLIIVVGIIHIFSFVYREIHYNQAVDYSRIARDIFLLTGCTLYLYSQKDNFGYYFSIFYFCAGLLDSFTYFYLWIPDGLFHDMLAVRHVTISGFSELLLGYLSLAALFILIKNGANDMKRFWIGRAIEIKKLFQFKFYSKRP